MPTDDTDRGEPAFRETTERFWLLRLVTEVRDDELYVRLEPLQRSPRHIASDEIEEVHVETYSATTYGGWHWGLRRTLGGNTVYRLRGDRGVELVLTDGERVFVGSERPEDLAEAIQRVVEGE